MRLNFHAAHKRLWNWLAENPSRGKHSWPEWKCNGGNISEVVEHCFACEVGYKNSGTTRFPWRCYKCPMSWGKFKYCHSPGYFSRWEDAEADYAITKNAKIIANLPWNGRKVFEI